MSPFHFPASGFTSAVNGLGCFVCLAWDVGFVTTATDEAFNRLAGVTLVETQMLPSLCGGDGTLNWNRIERGRDQLLIRHIGSVHGDRQWHAATIDEQGTLHAEFPTIRRIFPRFFPRPTEPSSWLHPCFAMSSRSP